MASQSRRAQTMGTDFNTSVLGRDVEVSATNPPSEDPLQPLRAMADRVGKEVERFAEKVDNWYAHGTETRTVNYGKTLELVHSFKDLADATVKELKKQNEVEDKGDLAKSVRRRIQTLADTPRQSIETDAMSTVSGVDSTSSSLKELRQWQAESATWELVRIIFEHYYSAPDDNEKLARKVTTYAPNNEIWERFMLEDSCAKEKSLVLKWLEQTAAGTQSDIESIIEQLEKESGQGTQTWTQGWLDTKARIKQEKRLTGLAEPIGKGHPPIQSRDRAQILVSQLDPDAPTRQRRNLEKADDYGERALWMACYEMVRRGTSWKDIAEWCKSKNEAWRGVSIGAAFDETSRAPGHPNLAGPSVGFLWRRMCFMQARGARYPYEAALYGLLGADLKSVEPVCRSWDDHLYARYHALLLSRFDSFLQKKFPGKVSQTMTRKFISVDAVKALGGSWENSAAQTIEALRQQKSTAALSAAPFKLIQGSLIAGSFDELLVNTGLALWHMMRNDNRHTSLIVEPNSWMPDTTDVAPLELEPELEKRYVNLASDPHALRIAVHILILLRGGLEELRVQDHPPSLAAVDNVIAGYIEFLRVARMMELIPVYAAQLQGYRAYHCLGRILPDIKNPHEQKIFVESLESYRLDPEEAILENYQTVLSASGLMDELLQPIARYEMLERTGENDWLWPGYRIKKNFFDESISLKEGAIIDCVQWYSHIKRGRSGTFVSLTDAMKHFLLQGRLGAAVALCRDMGVETVSALKTPAYCGFSFDFTLPGAEVQDNQRVNWEKKKTITARQHSIEVEKFRVLSQTYHEMQQLATVIELFSQWREEEDDLIASGGQEKGSTKNVKALFESIDEHVNTLLSGFLTRSSQGIPFAELDTFSGDAEERKNLERELDEFKQITAAYIPEVILGYISVTSAAGCFLSRELMTKGLEIANVVADDENKWLRNAFKETGRMGELVHAFAALSQRMLEQVEKHPKAKSSKKKRDWQGETLRIWDINVRN